MLTYESASELLYMNLEEEAELRILSEAANLRLWWRRHQVDLFSLIGCIWSYYFIFKDSYESTHK